MDYIQLLLKLSEINKQVVMASGMIFVNGLPLFVIISRKMNFKMVENVPKSM